MQKVGLLDVVPAKARVKVNDEQELEFGGLSLQDAAAILGRFPEIGALFEDTKDDNDDVFQKIVENAPQVLAVGIAAACGHMGDKVAEEVAARLPIDAQVNIAKEALRLTLVGGLSAFIEQLKALSPLVRDAIESDVSSTGSGSASPKPSKS